MLCSVSLLVCVLNENIIIIIKVSCRHVLIVIFILVHHVICKEAETKDYQIRQ